MEKKVKDQTSQQLISPFLPSTSHACSSNPSNSIDFDRAPLDASRVVKWPAELRNDASQIHLRREQREIAWMQLHSAMSTDWKNDYSRAMIRLEEFSLRDKIIRVYFFWIAFLG